jgi:uncharacterized protein
MSAVIVQLPNSSMHLQHGPIDCIVRAWGRASEVDAAYAAIASVFPSVLQGLVDELPMLRTPLNDVPPLLHGLVAQRMRAACWPYRAQFITPMAAVAGSVADFLLERMCAAAPHLHKAFVNDGGDIAFHLANGESLDAGIVAHPQHPALAGQLHLDANTTSARGLATSGWRGRSLSLGIADAVTVLACDAAAADAAATMVANAVNVDHLAIKRRPAQEVKDDSDLGDQKVTVAVGRLPVGAIHHALDAGAAYAEQQRQRGHLDTAILLLQGHSRVIGTLPSNPPRNLSAASVSTQYPDHALTHL